MRALGRLREDAPQPPQTARQYGRPAPPRGGRRGRPAPPPPAARQWRGGGSSANTAAAARAYLPVAPGRLGATGGVDWASAGGLAPGPSRSLPEGRGRRGPARVRSPQRTKRSRAARSSPRARRLPPPHEWKLETPAGARELTEGVSSAPEVELFPGGGGTRAAAPGCSSVPGCRIPG